jgi:hypothetical protein
MLRVELKQPTGIVPHAMYKFPRKTSRKKMSKRAGEPLRKVTLNLYDKDVEELQRLHGWGWSELVRELIHGYLRRNKDERSR